MEGILTAIKSGTDQAGKTFEKFKNTTATGLSNLFGYFTQSNKTANQSSIDHTKSTEKRVRDESSDAPTSQTESTK